MKQFLITASDAGQRLDKFLQKAAPALPPALLYKSLRTKHIKLNRKRAEGSVRLQPGDLVDCWLSDEFFAPPPWQYDFLQAQGALELLYEDPQILLLDKPAGLLSHPDEHEYVDTLLGRVQRYLYEKGEYRPAEEQAFAPALVNRIDRNTQGIVIAAKTAPALRVMSEKLKERQLRKYYLCAVHGLPQAGEPMPGGWRQLRHWLQKDQAKSLVRVLDAPGPGAKQSLLNYRVLHSREGLSLLEVELCTGRTHQIRAQLAAIGHALVGDGKYAPRALYQTDPVKRQCLCSWRLMFDFRGPPCELEYLNGLEISVKQAAFLRDIFPEFPLPGGNS